MSTADPGYTGGVPIADRRQVRRAALSLVRLDLASFVALVVLNGLAAAAGLVGPWLLGRIINAVDAGRPPSSIDRMAAAIGVFALAQLILTRYAQLLGRRFGERTQSRIRERFLHRSLALPAAVVERSSTGDLIARGTNDVAVIGTTLRDAGPALIIATLQALFIVVAAFLVSPLLGALGIIGLGASSIAARWYLRRARRAYLAEGAAVSAVADELSADARGARTIEALGLRQHRRQAAEGAIEANRRARMHTLYLRTVLFPSVDVATLVPVVLAVLLGGALHDRGSISLGAVVSAALYLRQLSQPVDTILLWAEQLQRSGASFARVEGLASVATADPDAACSSAPDGDRMVATGVSYAYGGGPDVILDVDLTVQPGERLAIVGPSGAGKTTLGRLLAGIDEPRAGTVTVGGVPVAALAADQLRRHVVLVTQEQHVFLGTLRDNLKLAAPTATDPALLDALRTVGAEWAGELRNGLDTELRGGGYPIDAGQAQQLALARVILADPHTVILDEATALLSPGTAHRTERNLASVLVGRTVIAIAHRLHTSHDATRVAVMQDGRIAEIGPPAALVQQGGAYAELWRSWHGAGARG